MPTRSYTNADLQRLARTSPITGQPYDLSEPADEPLMGQTFEPGLDPLDETRETDAMLALAKDSLGRADTLSRESSTRNLMNLPTRLASLSTGPRPTLSNVAAGLTEPMRAVGQGLIAGSLPASLAASPVAGGSLLGAGMILSAPDVLRRLLIPRQGGADTGTGPVEDETRGGAALEAAGLAAPQIYTGARAGIRAGRQAYQGAREAQRVTAARAAMKGGPAIPRPASAEAGPSKFSLGREVPLASTAPAVDPNQIMRVAQEVADETGVPITEVLKGYGGGEARQNALSSLLMSGRSGPALVKRAQDAWRQQRADIMAGPGGDVVRDVRASVARDLPWSSAPHLDDLLQPSARLSGRYATKNPPLATKLPRARKARAKAGAR